MPRIVLIGAIVASCAGVESAREWTLTASVPSGRAYPVIVHDLSGRVVDVELDPAGLVDGPFTNPAGQPNVVLVPWTGGACDTGTDITIRTVDGGPGMSLDVRTAVAPGGCDAIGVGHILRVTSVDAVPADRVLVGTVEP